MSNKMAELKKINAEKKALAEKQKALRVELEATKEGRKEVRSIRATCRKEVLEHKATLRELTTKIFESFSNCENEEIAKLAEDIKVAGTALSDSVKKFAEADDGVSEVESTETETESEDL